MAYNGNGRVQGVDPRSFNHLSVGLKRMYGVGYVKYENGMSFRFIFPEGFDAFFQEIQWEEINA